MVAPDPTELETTLTRDRLAEIAPGLTRIVGSVDVTAVPPTLAPIVVGVPETSPVNVAL